MTLQTVFNGLSKDELLELISENEINHDQLRHELGLPREIFTLWHMFTGGDYEINQIFHFDFYAAIGENVPPKKFNNVVKTVLLGWLELFTQYEKYDISEFADSLINDVKQKEIDLSSLIYGLREAEDKYKGYGDTQNKLICETITKIASYFDRPEPRFLYPAVQSMKRCIKRHPYPYFFQCNGKLKRLQIQDYYTDIIKVVESIR